MGVLHNNIKSSFMVVVAAAATLFISGCKPAPQVDADSLSAIDQDPLEGLNRAIFDFNHALDVVLLKPVATVYHNGVPDRGRAMVSNAVSNIYEPVVFANSLLQTDPENSFSTLWRFMINSTFGIGGLFDVASDIGLKNHKTDFGQTLAIYGASDGPYVVLPIIGPSTARDTVGRIGDMAMNPITYTDAEISYTVFGVTLIEKREANLKLVDSLYASSLDPYVTFRSAYLQHRHAEINSTSAARKASLTKAGFYGEPGAIAPESPVKTHKKKMKKAVVPNVEAPASVKVD